MNEIFLAKSDRNELRKHWVLTDGKPTAGKVSPGDVFTYETKKCRAIEDVYELLTQLADDPSRSIVAGRPLVASGPKSVDRFDDPKTIWWMIDLDGVQPVGSVPETIEHYLPCLEGCSYVYAFSASAGFKKGVRVRVVVRVEPTTRAELKRYAIHYNQQIVAYESLDKAAKPVDPQIYTPNQFIFTARPKLTELDDPYKTRVFLVDGWRAYPELPQLPPQVLISFEGGPSGIKSLPYVSMKSSLPRLFNFGHFSADGHDRGIDAIKALGRLKHYMGAEAFVEDAELRDKLWEQILEESGATSVEKSKYLDFAKKRASYTKERSDVNVRTVPADAWIDDTMGLAQATTIVSSAISRGMNRVLVTAVAATPGTGKTRLALEAIKRKLTEFEADRSRRLSRARDEEEERLILADRFNVDIFVPTTKLAREVWEACEKLGIPSFVEYGRGAEVHVADPIYGGQMACGKSKLAEFVSPLVDNTSQHLCDNGETQCALIDTCRHMWQRRETQHIPVRIRAHSFLARPAMSEKHPDYRPTHLAVIDEASFTKSLVIDNKAVKIGDLIAPRLTGDDYKWVLKFAGVLAEGLTIVRLRAAGFTTHVFNHLKRQELALRPELPVSPVFDDDVDEELKKLADEIRTCDLYASTWRQLRNCLESSSMNRVTQTKDYLLLQWHMVVEGIPQQAPPLEERRDVNGDPILRKDGQPMVKQSRRRYCTPAIPVLLLSGSMKKSIIEQFFEVDEWVECNVRLHERAVVRQVTSLRGSMAECLYGATEARRKEGETDEKRIKEAKDLRAFLAQLPQSLISFKALGELGVPIIANYGATEGLNAFEGQDLAVYGRLLPEPHVVERQARAIFCDGEEIRRVSNWPRRWRQVPGCQHAFEGEYHPDPRVDDVRWTICEGEMLQAIHRARPIRHPVTITIMSKQIVGVMVTELLHDRMRLHPEYARLRATKVLPGRREMAQLWPVICADGRTAERLAAEIDTRGWGEIKYRRGKSKWSSAKVRTTRAVDELGDVEWEWVTEIDERLLILDELEDIGMREPMIVVSGRGVDVRPADRSYTAVGLFDEPGEVDDHVPQMVAMPVVAQWPWAQ